MSKLTKEHFDKQFKKLLEPKLTKKSIRHMTMKQVLARIAKSKDITALKSPLREIKKDLAAMRKTIAWHNRVMAKSRLEKLS